MSKLSRAWPIYRRLLEYVKPYRGRLVTGMVCGILYGATNAAVLQTVRKLWKFVFDQRSTMELTGWQLLGISLLLPVAMLARGACDFFSTYLLNWVGTRAVTDLRMRLFAHFQELSLDYFTGSRTGELISRVTSDVQQVQQAISNAIEDIIKEPVTLVAVFGWLLYLNWKLTLMSTILFPVCLVPITLYGRRTRKASRATQEHMALLVSILHEAVVGMRVVKAFSMEQAEIADFTDRSNKVFRQRMRVIVARAANTPLIELVAGIGAAFVFSYAYRTQMASADLIVFGLGLFMLYAPIKKISRVHMLIQESAGAGERIFAVLDTKPSVKESPAPKPLPTLKNTITFDHLTFHYQGAEDGRDGRVLEDVCLDVKAGSVVAFVGSSGAGKTTLFNMVPRFYDPTSGAVRIDGQDIREGSFRSLRDQIGVVTQDTFLFNDTVANNISYGKPSATKDEIIAAAKRAHAHDFVSQMAQGYDTVIGEFGVRLSGGQRQRLAIARAILKNPPILLLDEATSALDTESERAVQAALDDLIWGKSERQQHTMLVIAHRLSTVQHADEIVVLDKGRIVERGTHEQLLKQAGTYKRLYDLQFKV